MTPLPLPMVLRPAEAEDHNFVIDSWMKSYSDSPWSRTHGPHWWDGHRMVVKRLIATCPILIACWEDAPDTILGWACTDANTVHYCYVKEKFRKHGIATTMVLPLLANPCIRYSHMLPSSQFRVPEGWTFDPYTLFQVGD